MEQRKKAYDRFLIAVSRSEVLKSCKFVPQFLSIADRKYFSQEQGAYEKKKFGKAIEEVLSTEG